MPTASKPQDLSRYLKLLHTYGRTQRLRVFAILVVTGLITVVGTLQPWSLKILIDYGLRGDPVPPWLQRATVLAEVSPTARTFVYLAGLASLALFGLSTALNCGMNWLWTLVGRDMTNAVARDMFGRLQRRSLLVHHKSSIGDSLSRLTTDAWCLVELTHVVVVGPASQILSLALMGAVSWKLDSRLALLSLVMAPLLALSSRFFGKRMKHRAKEGRKAETRLVSFVQQTLTAVPVVQAFGRENFNRRRFDALANESTIVSQQGVLIASWFGLVTGLITTAGAAIVLYVGGQRVLSGALSVGGLLVFVTYMNGLQNVSAQLLNLYAAVKPLEARIDRVLEILDASDAVPEKPRAPALIESGLRVGRHVTLENVSFGYAGGGAVVEQLDIEARPGQTVALVGETGAGKSTVAGLIPRFYDPWSGRVTIDGADVRDLQLASVRRQVALVLQEAFILPISIADNIAYGNPHATPQQIREAAAAAAADRFIETLPNGYDTIVGERGATLSGGEKQRLSIARALLKDAPILILDEPTSALDAATEASLVAALKRLMVGRTTFIVGHRLSTLKHADDILVFDRGRIVERGTHDALMGACGRYYRYFTMQVPERPVEASA